MKSLPLLFLAALITCDLFALEEFYPLSRSVRAMGMGGAHYALSDDESALFYNPASLGFYKGGGELMLAVGGQISSGALGQVDTYTKATNGSNSLTSLADQLTPLAGKPLSAGATVMPFYHRKGLAVGLLLADAKINTAYIGRDVDSYFDITALVDSGLFIGKSFALGKTVSLGLNTKVLMRAGAREDFAPIEFVTNDNLKFSDNSIGVGVGGDFDLGITWEPERALIGSRMGYSLVVTNLLATKYNWMVLANHTPPALQRMLSAGMYSVIKGGKVIDYVILSADFAELGIGGQDDPHLGSRKGSVWKHVNLGMEFALRTWLILRTGLHQGNITGGISLQSPVAKLEFATYEEELALNPGVLSSRRFMLRLVLGAGSSYKAPYSK